VEKGVRQAKSNKESKNLGAGLCSVAQGRVVLVGPGRAIGVSISIIVAEQIVTLSALVMGHLEGLVHSRQEILHQVRNQINQTSQILLRLRRRQTPHQIKRTVQRISHCFSKEEKEKNKKKKKKQKKGKKKRKEKKAELNRNTSEKKVLAPLSRSRAPFFKRAPAPHSTPASFWNFFFLLFFPPDVPSSSLRFSFR
jgi:hypothetical protein